MYLLILSPEQPYDIVGTYTYDITDTSSRTLVPYVFVRYLTGSWAQASSYTWQQSQQYTLSFQGNFTSDVSEQVKLGFNLTGSYTTTYSVAITIPADSGRWSKLGYFTDIYQQSFSVHKTSYYYQAQTYVYNDYSATSKEPTSTTYLGVVYKDALPPGAYSSPNDVFEEAVTDDPAVEAPATDVPASDTPAVETPATDVPAA